MRQGSPKKPNFLRKNSTKSEKILWKELRNRKLGGLKFRRQHPMDGFVLDFYCVEYRLGIELDGKIHEKQKEYDEWRESVLREKKIRILRFTNEEVETDLNGVLEKLKVEIGRNR